MQDNPDTQPTQETQASQVSQKDVKKPAKKTKAKANPKQIARIMYLEGVKEALQVTIGSAPSMETARRRLARVLQKTAFKMPEPKSDDDMTGLVPGGDELSALLFLTALVLPV
jgi:hypothetical protein